MSTMKQILSLAVMLAAVLVMSATGRAQSGQVQIVAADAKVYVSPDASSAVLSPVPVGAMLEVMNKSGTWIQVKLPKDKSGFDRVGFVQAAKVKEMAAPAGGGAAKPAAGGDAGAGAGAKAGRPTSAVLNFEYGAIQNWWGGGQWDLGKGIADLLVDELLTDGQLRLLERKQLENVLGEQNLSNSDRADPSAASVAQLRKMLGARVLITGTITRFGSEEKQVGGAAGSVAGRFIGGAGAKNTTALVALTARAIDTTTGEVLAGAKSEAKSSRKGLLLGGTVAGNSGAINMDSKEFRETILGEATEKAVKDLATQLAAKIMKALQ